MDEDHSNTFTVVKEMYTYFASSLGLFRTNVKKQ